MADNRRPSSRVPAWPRRLPIVWALLVALALLPALARADEPSTGAAVVEGIRTARTLEAWVEDRWTAAGDRASGLEAAVDAGWSDEAAAASALAEAAGRRAGLLADAHALRLDAEAARAARDAEAGRGRTLDDAVTAGMAALSAHGRDRTASGREVAHLRAVVGGFMAPYALDRERRRLMAERAATLADRAREVDRLLETSSEEVERRGAALDRSRSATLAVARERDEALARRDALAAYLRDLTEKAAWAEVQVSLSDPARADITPQGDAARPHLIAVLGAGDSIPDDLGVSSRVPTDAIVGPRLPGEPFGARPDAATLTASAQRQPFFAPVVGREVSPRGAGRARYKRGLLFETALRQTVSAPCDGQVVFAEPFKGFGLLLIIDRGDGYHALLSGLSRLTVDRGAGVVAGQAVGEVDPGGGVTRLYLELRHRGSPVDPAAWSALREDRVRS